MHDQVLVRVVHRAADLHEQAQASAELQPLALAVAIAYTNSDTRPGSGIR